MTNVLQHEKHVGMFYVVNLSVTNVLQHVKHVGPLPHAVQCKF